MLIKRMQQMLPEWFLRHWPLLVIITTFLILESIYIRTIPVFEGPDEAQHFAYITWLAEGKGFPPQGDEAWDTPIRQQASQAPLYYMIASVPARLLDVTNPRAIYRPNPHAFSGPWPRTIADNANRTIHFEGEAEPLAGGWLALYTARIISSLFGVLLLIGVYGLTIEVYPDVPAVAYAATFLVAVTPQILFIGSVASNDIPAAALSTVTLWMLAALVRQGPTLWRGVAVGLFFGLASLTKISAIALGLPVVAAFAWMWLSKRYTLKQLLFPAGLALVLSAFLGVGWWIIRSMRLYASPLGLETHSLAPWAIQSKAEIVTFEQRWIDVFRSFWVSLGWGPIRPPEWFYITLGMLTLVAVAGFVIIAWRWWRQPRPRPATRMVLLALLLLSVLAVGISLEMWMRQVVAPHGRLMFPAAAAFCILLVSGWYAIHHKFPFIVIGFVALLAIVAPFWLVKPAFALPDPLSLEEVEALTPTLGWRFGPTPDEAIAELLSARVLAERVEIGDFIPVELCWRVLSQSDRPYTVLVHIIGPDNRLIANRRTYPGLGHYPTTYWEPDVEFCDLVRVDTRYSPNDTMVYKVEVALLDIDGQQRALIFDTQSNPIAAAFIGNIHITSTILPPPLADLPDGGVDALTLNSYEVPETISPGQSVDILLRWRSNRAVDKDYQVFVHFRDPESDEPVVQADGPPLDGWYPTSHWQVGQTIDDERRFTIPDDTLPGEYDLFVGLYDLETFQRLGQEYNLGAISIAP